MRYTVKYIQVALLSWAHKTERGYETWLDVRKNEVKRKEHAHIMTDLNDTFRFKAMCYDSSNKRWWFVVDEVKE